MKKKKSGAGCVLRFIHNFYASERSYWCRTFLNVEAALVAYGRWGGCPTCSYTVGCCFGSLLGCPTFLYVIIAARNIFSKRKLTFFF